MRGGALRHVLRISAVLTFLAVIALVVGGCGDTEEEKAIKQVFRDQVEALENEDLEGVLATIHPESPEYGVTRDNIGTLFELFDLEYKVDDIEVVKLEGNLAEVRAVRESRVVNEPAEGEEGAGTVKDTRRTELYEVRKTGEGWKIYTILAVESSEEL